ncbi:TetR/AcrR family transcriptional regulator [Niallia sp. NCCP-28]|uniref:TetR/AcrR family transcriptional regulator n=1 Tax=Niallia sp. NCCP-28 TaxID=2934712 RepID=UPI0020892A9B|nr:TetR/AcrR family transcriptional regulator [Niallia sp. NCCP-28]GKU82196.1 putative HTH-type transcriptional regulator YxbF [Niallia sp. NCCP-28]
MSHVEVKQAADHLKHTMLMLLRQKGIQQIQVKEITAKAHVSRKIMLQFYPDKYAIFNEIVADKKEELSKNLLETNKICDKIKKEDVIFCTMLDFVQKNKFFFQTFIDRRKEPYIDFYDFFIECQQSVSNELLLAHSRAVTFYMISLYAVKENAVFSFNEICEMFHKFNDESLDKINRICLKITGKYREKSKVEEILQHAFKELLLEKEKYESITISDIMRKSNLRRATFYECYSSKEDLLSALLQEECCKLIKLYYMEFHSGYDGEIQSAASSNQAYAYFPLFHICKNGCSLPNLLTDMINQIISLYMGQKRKFDRENILNAYFFSNKILAFFLERLYR